MADDLEIRVNRVACCGACECLRRAPRSFSLDAQRKAVAAEKPLDPSETIVEAARACPNFAVQVWRGGRKLV